MFWFSKKQQEISDSQKLEWEFHQNHRQYLRSEKHTMDHQYTQLLVYLNSGIFIASSVIANMYEKIGYKSIIVTSWWLSAISLIFILLSFVFSIESFKYAIRLWDKERKEDIHNIYVRTMNISICISTFLLFSAIVLTLIFFTLNFLHMSDTTSKTFVETTLTWVQKKSEPVSAGMSPAEFLAQTGTKIK